MTALLRRLTSRALLIYSLVAAGCALVLIIASSAIGAAGDADRPPAKPLSEAIASALQGANSSAFSARVVFTNDMIEGAGLVKGSDPIMAGGEGRIWVSESGDMRLELQSDAAGGDAQIMLRGDQAWMYHAAANTVYRFTLPSDKKQSAAEAKWPPSVRQISRLLESLGSSAYISGAIPGVAGGQAAYSTRVDPKDKGGLLAGADITWDAKNGAPLRLSLYASGQDQPVLALEASEVDFGAIDKAVFSVQPPADAKVETLDVQAMDKPNSAPALIKGLPAARAAADFKITAPASLAGRSRQQVMLRNSKQQTTIIRYGTGLGSLTVMERTEDRLDPREPENNLPILKVDGKEVALIATPLGSVASFQSQGVNYVIFGSVTKAVLLQALKAL